MITLFLLHQKRLQSGSHITEITNRIYMREEPVGNLNNIFLNAGRKLEYPENPCKHVKNMQTSYKHMPSRF